MLYPLLLTQIVAATLMMTTVADALIDSDVRTPKMHLSSRRDMAIDPLHIAAFAARAVDVPVKRSLAEVEARPATKRHVYGETMTHKIGSGPIYDESQIPGREVARRLALARRAANSDGDAALFVPVKLASYSPAKGSRLMGIRKVGSGPARLQITSRKQSKPLSSATASVKMSDSYSWSWQTKSSSVASASDSYSWSWQTRSSSASESVDAVHAPTETASSRTASGGTKMAPEHAESDDLEWEDCLIGEPGCEEIPDTA